MEFVPDTIGRPGGFLMYLGQGINYYYYSGAGGPEEFTQSLIDSTL